MLAAFIVNEPLRNVELQRSGNNIQVVNAANNADIILSIAADDIDNDQIMVTVASLIVDSAVNLDGNSLTVKAARIELATGSITTADGTNAANAGDITFTARQIIIGPGSSLNTQAAAAGGLVSGSVTLTASDEARDLDSEFSELMSPASGSVRSAKIDLSGATILAADIKLAANGITANRWDDVGAFKDNVGTQLLDQLQAIPQIGISTISPLSGQVKVHESTAEISILNSTLTSSGSVAIDATAAADASINAVAINGTRADSSSILVSLAFSTSLSTATIALDGTTTVTASEKVDVTSNAVSKSKVLARADANTRASSSSVAGAFNLAGAYTTETSTINLAPNASINAGGTVKLDAKGDVNNDVKATTAIFQDGTGGLSASIGVDIANVKAIVRGKITSAASGGGGPLSFGQANINAATDSITLASIPAANPLVLGERLTYTAGAAELGLVDGVQYIIHAVTDPLPSATAGLVTQTVKLVAAETIDLDARQVPNNSEHTLTRLATIQFTEADVSSEASGDGLITLAGLPANVAELVYLGPDLEANEDATGIVGLIQNQTYQIERTSGGAIKLKLPGTTAAIDFVAPAAGTQGFYYTDSVKTFAPSTAVDRAKNTIDLPAGHGLKTGDLVFYGTDATRTIERAIEDFGAGNTSTGELGRVNLPDAPIRGLDDEGGYHVVIDPAQPNKIRLTTSLFAAAAAAIQDLQLNAGNGHSFAREAAMQQGIIVNASLVANNVANAGVTLSDSEQPWAEVAFGAAGGDPDKIATGGYGLINALRSKINENTVDKAKEQTGSDNSSRKDVDLAGTVAFTYFDHDVESRIATGAVLTSASDLIVDGKITQKTKLTSASSATRRGVDDDENTTDPRKDADPNDDGDTEISVAIAVGIYHNDANALVDSGATTDANRHTIVRSAVDYPLLASSVTEAINPLVMFQSGGLGGVGSMLDGAAGLSQIFNMSISTIAGAPGDKLVLAAGVGVTEFNNVVTARIAPNAMVNQNVALATHDPSVSVTSNLSGDLIEVGQMAAFNLDVKGFIEAIQDGKIKDPLGTLKQLANPFGISGKNAAGGVFLVTLANNETIAELQAGAKVKADGKVAVAANSDFYNVAVVQTGANSTDFGFSASVAVSDIDNKTIARISEGADVFAGSLDVKATDGLSRIAIAGAFLKGKQVGIGASVAVNLIEQQVAASIGRSVTTADANIPAGVTMNIAGDIDVTASTDGDLFALVIAGALQGFGKAPTSGDSGGATTKANAKQIGAIALTVPVAINNVNSDVSAYLDSQNIRAANVTLDADSAVDIHAVIIGASFAIQTKATGNGKLNLAGAGAVGVNTVVQNVAAFIKDSDVQTVGSRGINLDAMDRSSVRSDAGGFALTVAASSDNKAALSFGVSVAINDISGTVTSYIDDATLRATAGDIVVNAKSESVAKVLSIAGGVSARGGQGLGGTFGGAGAAAQNEIAKMVSAEVRGGSAVAADASQITVAATDSSEIVANAGGIGISVNLGSGNSIAGAIGISIALNDIENSITAAIDSSTANASGDVTVNAKSEDATIDVIAIAASGGVAAGSGLSVTLSGAGSGAHNDISNTIDATINNATVTATAADVNVAAEDRSTINSVGVGASVGVAASSSTGVAVSVGISVGKNEIGNRATASITHSTINAGRNVMVDAKQTSTISSIAVAASIAVGAGQTGVGASGAGAIALNEISNKTFAFIDGGKVDANGNVSVEAIDNATIKSEIVAASVGAGGGATGVGAALGISIAENRIGDSTTFSADPKIVGGAKAAQVKAYVSGAEIDAEGNINVKADATGSITATVAAASVAAAAGKVGVAAAGAGVASSNTVETEIVAVIQDATGTGIDGATGVSVAASNNTTINTTVLAATLAVAIGKFSGGLSVAVSETNATINNKVQAGIRRSRVNSSGGISVRANENANVTAVATAAAAAASIGIGISIAGGGAIASGDVTSSVDAHITDSTVTTTQSVSVSTETYATTDISTKAITISLGLIGLGASGSSARTSISPTIASDVRGSDITAGSLLLGAALIPFATTDAAGLTISTGLALGVSEAAIELGGSVTSKLDSASKTINVGGLEIYADSYSFEASTATAQGSAGGLLIGVDATITSVTNTVDVKAEVADNSVINATGNVTITANTTTHQNADSSSFAIGLVAAGITKANAESDTSTIARIGKNARISARDFRLDADGNNKNFANTTSGAAGGISGAVALPSTSTTASTSAIIDDDAILTIEQFTGVSSNHTAEFNSTLMAIAGGVLSGGGGDMDNVVVSNVTTRIGDRTEITSGAIEISTGNLVDKADLGEQGNVDAIAGGLIAGVGVDSDTNLTIRSNVVIGEAAKLVSTIGQLILSAENTINATERLTLKSGGLAAGGISDAAIRTLVDEATVTIGENANLSAANFLLATARGSGDINVQNNSETFGAASVTAGVTTIDIKPVNTISVGSGATIQSDRDLSFVAGVGRDGEQDRYEVNARVDSFAGSAIPIDLMDARADLIQTNRITVASGANVRSGGDIKLYAERFGDNNVRAQVKAVNWLDEVASGIDGLLGSGGVEQLTGTSNLQTSGIVRVDGKIETGINRNRILEIAGVTRERTAAGVPESPDLYTVVLADRSTADVPFTKKITSVTSSLDVALQEAYKQLDFYRENNNTGLKDFYESEIGRIRKKLADQALLEIPAGAPDGVFVSLSRQTITLEIAPIIAQAGSIDVRGGELIGDGDFVAPGDAKVEIINNSPASIEIRGITIPPQNGGASFNGERIDGAIDDGVPSILVDNRANIESPALTNNGELNLTWPSITVSGTVENLGGSATLQNFPSGAGNIAINGGVFANEQLIRAGNQGAASLNQGRDDDGRPFEPGGVAHTKWTQRSNGGDGTGPVQSSRWNEILGQTPSDSFSDVDFYGNRVFITAGYINVNGVIQSGRDEYELTIGQDIANQIAQLGPTGVHELNHSANSDFALLYNSGTGRIIVNEIRSGGGFISLTGHISNTLNGELRVLGGYTNIRIDNQTNFDIELNRLDVSEKGDGRVIINDLNRGTEQNPHTTSYVKEGSSVRVTVNNEAGESFPGTAPSFQYRPQDGLRYGWVIGQDQTTRTQTTYKTAAWLGIDALAANPDNIVGTPIVTTLAAELLDAGAYYFVDTSNPSPYTYQFDEENNLNQTTRCCDRSESPWYHFGVTTYFSTVTSTTGVRKFNTHSIEADRPIDVKFLGESEGQILVKSIGAIYINDVISNASGTTTIIAQNGIVQNRPAGNVGGRIIDIDTEEPVGTKANPIKTDVTDLAPHDYISNQYRSGFTLPIARFQRVRVASDHTAGGKVGSVYQYSGDRATMDLRTQNYSDTSRWFEVILARKLDVQTTSDDISIHEVRGDLPIGIVVVTPPVTPATAGDVNLTAQGDIFIADSSGFGFLGGTSVDLVSEIGSIGTAAQPFGAVSDFFNDIKDPNNTFSAKAGKDIFLNLSETTTIDSIVAGGDVTIEISSGERGSLIDGNTVAIRDQRAIEEVVAAVWDDLQLTAGRGSQVKFDERVNAVVATETQAYNAYWNFRSTQADPSVYDPSHQVALNADERDFYEKSLRQTGIEQGLADAELDQFIANGITTLENNRTAQYHTLHNTWGGLGNEQIEDFAYEPTDAEIAAIEASMQVWTEDELRSLQSAGFLNVTDTEFVIEEPNIVGRNITLNISDGIGRYENGTTIDVRPINGSLPLLTIDELAVITAAEPNDIVRLSAAPVSVVALIDGRAIELSGGGSWQGLGFSVGQFVHLETNTRDTTDEGQFFEIESFSNNRMVLKTDGRSLQSDAPRRILVAPAIVDPANFGSATHLRVLRREDIDVRIAPDGVLNAVSERHVFIGSDSDLQIGQVRAGTVFDSNHRVQIKVDGAITDATDTDVPNIIGRRIVLEASRKNIGTEAKPLQIDTTREGDNFVIPDVADPIGNGYLIARAQKEVVIAEFNERKEAEHMFVGQVFSRESTVALISDGSILDAFDSDETNIRGQEIVLNSSDRIGLIDNHLEIDLADDGPLTAYALGSIYLTENVGNMNVRSVNSTFAQVELVADFSILDHSDVADPFERFTLESLSPNVFRPTIADPVIAGNPITDIVGLDLKLTAKNGSIGAPGNELDIIPTFFAGGTSEITASAGNDIYLTAPQTDLSLKTLTAGGTAFVSVPAGSIQSSLPPGESNILSGKVWLFAANAIGMAANPISTETGAIEAQAFALDLFVANKGDLVVGGVIDPFGNNFAGEGIDTGGGITLTSTGSIRIDEDVYAVDKVSIKTPGKLTVGADGGVFSEEAEAELTVEGDAPAEVEILGILEATKTTIKTGGGNDKVTIAPKESTGPVKVESGDGDDEVGTNGSPAEIDGGSGKNILKLFGSGTHLDLSRFADNSIKSFDSIDMRGTGPNRMSFAAGKVVPTTPGSPIELLQNKGDKADFGVGWKPERPQLIAGLFTHIISDGNAEFRVKNQTPYLNPVNNLDVNRSGTISPSDALVIINLLSNPVLPDLTAPITAEMLTVFSYFDPNNDGKLSPSDALMIINALSELGTTAQPEGEEIIGTLAQDVFQVKRIDAAENEPIDEWIPLATFRSTASFDQNAPMRLADNVNPLRHEEVIEEDVEDQWDLESTIATLAKPAI